MGEENTIAAISTARGQAGVGIVKISGNEAIKIADKVFKSAKGKKIKDLEGYRALYGRVYDCKECLDEVIVLFFKAPNSYTGEDVVEIQCHGGIYITEKILKVVLDNGAKLAAPGEFTQRAFLNGKLDLTEAEGVMDLISAQGQKAAKAALSARDGVLSKKVNGIKSNLLELAAHLSVFSDYPDEDIPELKTENLKENLKKIRDDLEKLQGTYDNGRVIKEGIDTVIVGKPNVGKSTLMNYLSGHDKSIVTDIPGTTRDVVEETINLGDITLKVSDTAGIRQTEDPVELIGVKKAKNKLKTADLVLAIFDLSRELSTEDEDLVENIKKSNSIAIFNKSDLEQKFDYEKIKDKFAESAFISAVEGKGIDDLKTAISKVINLEKIDLNDGFLFNRRQFECVKCALVAVNEAIDTLDLGFTLDAVEVTIEDAISELLKLTGERVTESVTKEVFSKFCVGK